MIYIYTYKNLEYTLPDAELDRALMLFKNAVINWGHGQVSMDWINDNETVAAFGENNTTAPDA